VKSQRSALREEDLTVWELDILRHIALGWWNHEIGEALHISSETVETQSANILSRLCAGSA
jgi:DNA-binding NarL/FixJ family response regulator